MPFDPSVSADHRTHQTSGHTRLHTHTHTSIILKHKPYTDIQTYRQTHTHTHTHTHTLIILHHKPYTNMKANTHTHTHIPLDYLTVYVFDHVDAEAVSGDGGEHLPGAGPPGQVMWWTPGCDGTEQQLQVVLLGQLLRRGHVITQLHQDLQTERKREERERKR